MTYAERIEAEARALYEVRPHYSQGGPLPWNELHESHRNYCLALARAADAACIKALEEPTDAIKEAGGDWYVETPEEDARRVWQAMWSKIDRG